MVTLQEQVEQLIGLGYKRLAAQAKAAHDVVLLAMHRSGFKPKSAIKGGVVMSSITRDIRRATMDMDIDFVHHSISKRSIELFVRGLDRAMPEFNIAIAGAITDLKHEDYRGKRVFVTVGDLFYRAATVEPILEKLKGRKHLILGNHDGSWTDRVDLAKHFESVQTLKEVNVDGRLLTLCHYPMLSYPWARRGYMIYGHIHNNVGDDYWPLIQRRPRMLNAGVEINGYEPVTFDELAANNKAFNAAHAEDAKANPFDLYCAER